MQTPKTSPSSAGRSVDSDRCAFPITAEQAWPTCTAAAEGGSASHPGDPWGLQRGIGTVDNETVNQTRCLGVSLLLLLVTRSS